MKLGLILSATDKMSRVVEQATQKSNKSLQKLRQTANKTAEKMMGIGAAVTAAGVGMGFAAFKGIEDVSSKAQKISNLTKELGNISADSVQVYADMLKKVGIDQDVFQKGVGRLAKNMTEVKLGGSVQTQRVFQALGLSVVDVHGKLKSTDEMMLQITDRLSKMKDSTAKTGLIMSLFGRSGKELIPILNQGAKGFEEERKAMQENGELMSSTEIAALVKTKGRLIEIQEKLEGMVTRIVASHTTQINSLIDKVSHLADAVANWVKNNKSLIESLIKAVPYIVGIGAVISGLGTLIKTAMTVKTIVNFTAAISKISFVKLIKGATLASEAIGGLGLVEKMSAFATKALAGMQWLLNAAFADSEIGWIVLAVGALVAAVTIAWKKFDWFRAAVKTTWDTIKGFGEVLKTFVIDRIKGIISGLGKMGEAISLLFKGKFKAADTTALKAVKELSGYDATVKAINGATVVTSNIRSNYEKHLVIERAVQHSKQAQRALNANAEPRASKVSQLVSSAAPVTNSSSYQAPVIHYTQNIAIGAGADQAAISKELKDHARDIVAIIDEAFRKRQRLSYTQ